MNEQAMKFRFGIFVLAVLILLAVLTMLFGGLPRYFAQNDPYVVIVDNAQGVTPGTPVRRSGVKIGEVRAVELDNDTGKVKLSILVDHEFTIHKDDRPTIVRGLLGGDVTLDFLPPENAQADMTPVPPGSQMPGYTPAEATELVQKTGELLGPAKDSLLEMQKVLGRIDKMMPLFEDTVKEFREVARATNRLVPEVAKTNDELRELSKTARQTVPELKKATDEFQLTSRIWGKLGERLDVMVQTNEGKLNKTVEQLEESTRRLSQFLSEENQKNLNQTLKNARVASEQFDSISRNTDEMIKDARITIKNLNATVIKADEVFGNLQKVTKPFSDSSPRILQNLDDSTVALNRTLNEFRELMREFARSEGTLQKLVTDPSLYNNLNDSAGMISRILPRLDRILGDVEIFADKIARHPESLGIGGVVRPGSGLKEPPTVLPWREPTEPRWRIWSH
jgi:phospholipid/cholesterol/gamma-HCH transport system substrate-binding protein